MVAEQREKVCRRHRVQERKKIDFSHFQTEKRKNNKSKLYPLPRWR